MLIKIMFPDELQLRVDRIELEDGRMVISVTAISEESICPHCGIASERIHSSYQRHPADLSLAGYTVYLDITVPRFFCDNGQCQANTFAERITGLIKPYAHRTDRLAEQQRRVAFEAGGRLLNELGMPVSPDTLIRLARNASEPEMNTPRVLGIDDWAKRKGQSYGTILVDLETHKPVDMLPDRTAESVTEWLRGHPGVEIISRDRGSEYIKGVTDGAPDAIQVADRWHLLTNLRDTLKRLLESKSACLRAAADKSSQDGSEHEQLEKSMESEEAPKVRTSDAPTKLTKAETGEKGETSGAL